MKKHTEKRPWGHFERFTDNEKTTVKIIRVKPHEKTSLQYHKYRDEFWKILTGKGSVIIGNKQKKVKAGDECVIPKKTQHRITAGKETLELLEISFGTFKEDDIIRIEDEYGRV